MAASPSEALVRRRATYQDVLDAPAHRVAEIVEGTLHTHPRPAMPHARASWVLGGKIGGPFDYGPSGPGGWWLSFEPELHLGEDVLVPDLAGWRRERMPKYPETAYVTLAPDWVCEVLSPSTRRLDLPGKRPVTHPRPAMPHGLATLALGTDLSNPFQFGRGGPGGWWIAFEPELHLGEEIVVPDLAGWRRERMPEYPQTAYVNRARIGRLDRRVERRAIRTGTDTVVVHPGNTSTTCTGCGPARTARAAPTRTGTPRSTSNDADTTSSAHGRQRESGGGRGARPGRKPEGKRDRGSGSRRRVALRSRPARMPATCPETPQETPGLRLDVDLWI